MLPVLLAAVLLAAQPHPAALFQNSAPSATGSQLPSAPAQAHPGFVAGKLLHHVQPVYPESAKFHHLSGAVKLLVAITTSGDLINISVLDSPRDSLSKAAIKAVRQWKYSPYLLNGQPTEVKKAITIIFHLGS